MFKFSPIAGRLLKQGFFLMIIVLGASATMAVVFKNSSYFSEEGHFVSQPIPFSHRLHAGDLGMDCTFCHTQAARSDSAGMPSMETCYGCHREVLKNVKLLDPVREAYRSGRAIHWNRVNRLPDHVYFRHTKHIKAGISCTHCHGDARQMPLEAKQRPFTMQWCLDCHKARDQRLQDCYTCHR